MCREALCRCWRVLCIQGVLQSRRRGAPSIFLVSFWLCIPLFKIRLYLFKIIMHLSKIYLQDSKSSCKNPVWATGTKICCKDNSQPCDENGECCEGKCNPKEDKFGVIQDPNNKVCSDPTCHEKGLLTTGKGPCNGKDETCCGYSQVITCWSYTATDSIQSVFFPNRSINFLYF